MQLDKEKSSAGDEKATNEFEENASNGGYNTHGSLSIVEVVVYKIVNKHDIKVAYSPEAMKLLLQGDDREGIIFDIEGADLEYANGIDGFNFFDYLIVSDILMRRLKNHHPKGDVLYVPARIRHKDGFLARNYYAMIIKRKIKVCAIDARYVDPSHDSRYPVADTNVNYSIFLDKELFFPVFSESIVHEIKSASFNADFFRYYRCGKVSSRVNEMFITPLPGVPGETLVHETENCIFYQCSESGVIWLSDKSFFHDIEIVVKKYPHRSMFYRKESDRWFPIKRYSYDIYELISSEETVPLVDMVNP